MIDEAGFKHPKFQMYVYYKYTPDGSKLVLLSYVDDCVYWYTSEELGKWFVDKLGKIFHVNFLGYTHWFMSIKISQLKDNYISVDQDRCYIYVVEGFLDTATIKEISFFCKTTLPHYMILIK